MEAALKEKEKSLKHRGTRNNKQEYIIYINIHYIKNNNFYRTDSQDICGVCFYFRSLLLTLIVVEYNDLGIVIEQKQP